MVDVPDVLDLTAPQTRVLGCLIEKRATTPETYPLTLKALTAACNQSSNRFPVVDYDTQLVETTTLALKGKGLARVVHPASGERATRYRHVVDEALGLSDGELAILSVLLLRGAQTVNELKTRTERLHPFDSAGAIESQLSAMGSSTRPLVMRLDRQSGQKEVRFIQLLEADVETRAAASASAAHTASGSSRGSGRVEELEARVGYLEQRLGSLIEALGDLIDLPDHPAAADQSDQSDQSAQAAQQDRSAL